MIRFALVVRNSHLFRMIVRQFAGFPESNRSDLTSRENPSKHFGIVPHKLLREIMTKMAREQLELDQASLHGQQTVG